MLPDLDVMSPWSRRGTDLLIGVTLLVCAIFGVWHNTGVQDHIQTLIDPRADDIWFEADVFRVYTDMTDRGANHYRTTVHPIFPLLTYPAIHASQKLLHTDKITAVRGAIALAAGVWLALFYALLRVLRCRRMDALLFALVAAATAGALFWTAVPETYEFGSLTILAVLLLAAASEQRTLPVWLDIAAGAASMSVLVTDFMVALASFVSRYRLQRAIQIACNALVVVVLLWGLQKYFFTSAQFFIGVHDSSTAPQDRPAALVVIFLHSFVAPAIRNTPNDTPIGFPMLSFQHLSLLPLDFVKAAAIISWLSLLGFAGWALVRLPQYPRFRIMLALSIAGQIVLHFVYGNETFLYTLDYLPLFLSAAALATLSRWRPVVLAAAVVFTVAGGIHNNMQLHAAFDMVESNARKAPPPPAHWRLKEYSDSNPHP
ncbi:MAG: hypothetical protein JSR66_27900 [Proteobacteria bacterium]|nr:hypothetical protein [Pseudomonadota bacterium]